MSAPPSTYSLRACRSFFGGPSLRHARHHRFPAAPAERLAAPVERLFVLGVLPVGQRRGAPRRLTLRRLRHAFDALIPVWPWPPARYPRGLHAACPPVHWDAAARADAGGSGIAHRRSRARSGFPRVPIAFTSYVGLLQTASTTPLPPTRLADRHGHLLCSRSSTFVAVALLARTLAKEWSRRCADREQELVTASYLNDTANYTGCS